jgi:hypothetical protein
MVSGDMKIRRVVRRPVGRDTYTFRWGVDLGSSIIFAAETISSDMQFSQSPGFTTGRKVDG